jgi:hypothetical protein
MGNAIQIYRQTSFFNIELARPHLSAAGGALGIGCIHSVKGGIAQLQYIRLLHRESCFAVLDVYANRHAVTALPLLTHKSHTLLRPCNIEILTVKGNILA